MGWDRFAAYTCSHGHLVNKKVVASLAKFLKSFKPKWNIHLGDWHDWGALRQGLRSDQLESVSDMQKDEDAGYATLELLSPNILMDGNHGYRLHEIYHNHANGMVRIAAKDRINKFAKFARTKLKAKLFPYHHEKGVFSFGPVKCVHGYTASANSVPEHAVHYGSNGDLVLMGHLHRMERMPARKWGGVEGWSVGMLADKEKMAYANRRLATSLWRNGWVYGVTNGKQYEVWDATQVGGKWLLPTGFEEL